MKTIKGHKQASEDMRDHHNKFILITSFFLYQLFHLVTLLLSLEKFNRSLITSPCLLSRSCCSTITHHPPSTRLFLVYIFFMVRGIPNPIPKDKCILNFKGFVIDYISFQKFQESYFRISFDCAL